jgi:hypothetical protein
MKKLTVLAVISVTTLIVLRKFGIQTEILVVDNWVDSVMVMLRMS